MSLITRICSLPGLFGGLDERDVDPDPLRQFQRWFRFARRARCYWPNSIALATATPDGRPAVRLMLLKRADERGFVFYTNYESRKGAELAANPRAAFSIHWVELIRQVRVEGRVERTTAEESDAYFQSRARASRIGAWSSRQSRVLAGGRPEFDQAVRKYTAQFKGGPVPLPPFWGGYRLVPDVIEFWQGRPHRLHDRIRYTRQPDGGWCIARLAP